MKQGLRLALIRTPEDGETVPLEKLFADVSASLQAEPTKAALLIQSTRTTAPDGLTNAEFAGWIVVANTILNLDEFLTRN